jgi:hypothetical protein
MRRSICMSMAIAACMSLSAFAVTRVNILWIGNSLSQSVWCTQDGFFEAELMANADSNATGYSLADARVMPGATNLATQWNNSNGFAQLASPACGKPSAWWETTPIDHYDYMVLQTFIQNSPVAAESLAMDNYCKKALSYGTKPVIFDCWGNPSNYTALTNALVAIYNRYKSQGALFAPLFGVHMAINAEKPTTYLYGADTYLHVTAVGAYCSIAVWEYLFTHVKPTNFTLTQCASGFTDKAYLDGKVEAELSKYYNLGNTAVVPDSRSGVASGRPQYRSAVAYDMLGRMIGRMNLRESSAARGLAEAKIRLVNAVNGGSGAALRFITLK